MKNIECLYHPDQCHECIVKPSCLDIFENFKENRLHNPIPRIPEARDEIPCIACLNTLEMFSKNIPDCSKCDNRIIETRGITPYSLTPTLK